jgi:hypothetical protein
MSTKKAIGISMIVGLFLAIFVYAAVQKGWHIAIGIYAAVIAIVVFVGLAVSLITSED